MTEWGPCYEKLLAEAAATRTKSAVAEALGVPPSKLYSYGGSPMGLRFDRVLALCEMAGWTSSETDDACRAWYQARTATGNQEAALNHLFQVLDEEIPQKKLRLLFRRICELYAESIDRGSRRG